MFADQGTRAAGLYRMASQAVNAGGGGLNTSGGLQLLAEVIQSPDSEMAFLDKPGDTGLEDHAGLVSNPRRIGRDEPEQVLIKVGVRKMGARNAGLPNAEKGEEEKKPEGEGGRGGGPVIQWIETVGTPSSG